MFDLQKLTELQSMYKVTTNKQTNTLHIAFSQVVGPRAAKHCREVVEQSLSDLKPGFRLLTDLSALNAMDYSCAAEISALMDLLRQKGIAKVVRVIPDPHKDIGFNMLTIFHYRHTVAVVTVQTLDEALKALA